MEVDKENYIAQRIIFSKDGRLERVWTVEELGRFHGRIDPQLMIMENPNTGSRTEIEVYDVQYNQDLNEALFHPRRFYR